MHAARMVLALVMIAVTATACGTSAQPGTAPSGSTAVTGELTVFAAASLTESFTQLGKAFEAAHPGTRVTFNFGGSSTLANQINAGAPADVFAAASQATMTSVTGAGNAASAPIVFARNELVIAVAKGNPQRVSGLVDLTRPGLKVALCAEQVPCGAAATKALGAAGVALTPVTYEPDVKGALTKVTLGEVDAALVYRTDVNAAASKVDGIDFPASAVAVNDYPIVVIKGGPNPAAAGAFVSYVQTDAAKAVLDQAGFRLP
ncbi:MAG TPA: molybdate ABC transporter substrate-binding protein [Micromonosporaceae bacterium]